MRAPYAEQVDVRDAKTVEAAMDLPFTGYTTAATTPMVSIVYASTASRAFSTEDLAALLEQSRESNARHDLTGLLVHRDGRFLQLLEGPEGEVRSRMQAIEADGRHHQVRVLLEDEIELRQFPEWTMGYRSTGDDDRDVPGFRRTFDDIDDGRSTSGTLPALRVLIAWFRDRHDA